MSPRFLHRSIEEHTQRAAQYAGDILRSPYGLWGLAAISFVESALVVPVVTDPFLVAYILADRSRTVKGVLVTLLASVLGGIAAYLMAIAFFEFVAAHYLTGSYGVTFYEIADEFHNDTFALTVLGALTPIPYTIIALVVGFLKGGLVMFIAASFLGRGIRYGVVGFFTYRFGEQALRLARARLALVTVVCTILVTVYILARFL